MKKFITLSLLAIFSLEMNAQTTILDFEDEEVTTGKITMTVQNESYVTDLYAENPDKEGVNTSDRCAHFCNTTSYIWWHGFYFTFNQNIEASGNKYLHMMMKKDIVEASNVSITLVNADGTQSTASATDSTTIFYPITTEWVDYVMEIPSGWETISGMYVKFNAAVGTNCYFDELYMDNDPTPRTTIVNDTVSDDDSDSSMDMSGQIEVADFESDIDTSVLTITGADETQQSIFELYAENPNKTGLNTTDKCLYIKSNQEYYDDYTNTDGRPTWGGNVFYITFEEAVTIDDANKYLHIMHMKGAILNQYWLVYGENGDGSYVEFGRGTTTEENVWYDIVVDMSAKLSTVKSIRVHLDGNWGTDPTLRFYEPTDFYYDEIIMNDDSAVRVAADAEPIVPVTDQNILDFDDEDVTSSRITMTVQSTSYLTDLYAENPDKEGANTSDRCATFCPDAYVWWHGFYFTFNQTVETTGYKYLHMMMKKSIDESSNVVVNLVDATNAQSSNDLFYQPVASTWTDYVLEIPESHEIVYGMWVKFNAAVGTTCYFDQLYMDNDPTPRTSLAGVDGIEASTIAKSVVCVNGKTITTANASQSMQVYNLLGGLVYEGEGSYEAKTAGIYVVKVNGTVQKVAVK